MVEIIPSMLVTDEEAFKKQTALAKEAVNIFQLDLADGKFAPNTTWAYQNPEKAQEYIELDFELHLMVNDPIKTLESWKNNPRLKRILFHFESVDDVRSTIEALESWGNEPVEIGIVLNPDTPIDLLEPYLSQLDAVMFMGVHPGFQGQKFIPETLERIKDFKNRETGLFVEIDGAVNEETLPGLVLAGADAVCPGSAIFGNDRTPAENVERMKDIINKLTP